MFSNAAIALVVALSAGTWVYTKINRSTGGNTQSSATVAGVAALGAFVVTLLLLNLIPTN